SMSLKGKTLFSAACVLAAKPQCRPNKAAASGKTPERSDASTYAQEGLRIGRCVWIEQESNSADCRGYLFQKFRPLAAQCRLIRHEAGDVATWMRQVRYKTAADWIGYVDKDHRDGATLSGERFDPDGSFHNDYVGLLLDDFFRHPRSIDIAGHPAIIGADISAHHPAKGLQRFSERRSVPLSFRIVRTPHPYCNLSHAHGLLRPRRERPRSRAAEQRDESARSHSISSSASNWIELGTSIPSALAACMLITNSNLVDCTTGRSAGLAPLST